MGTHTTYCRLCEVGCGLVAEVDDAGAITRLRPDRDHPVTAGFACNKGLLSRDVHHDPARVDHPIRRGPDGSWTRIEWDAALDEVASRLRAVVDEHGPSSVALYLGNPVAFNAAAGPAAGMFLLSIGSDRLFSAGTQDCANKFAVGELMWGSPKIHLVPDLDHTDHVLLLGTNPRVSKGSFLSIPDPVGRLAAVEARGGVVRFVDPRDVEPKVGETVQIRPDTDVYLLAAMLAEIDRTVGFVPEAAARVRDLDALRAFLADFPPERVAPVVGIDAPTIAAMARDFATAPSASAHCSTGVNMGRHGTLAYWLLQLLVLLTGNLDRRGGNIAVTAGVAPLPLLRDTTLASFEDTPWGAYRPASSLQPGALLEAMIREGDPPIRALVVVAGNPALSMGGGDRLAAALADLDLLVSLDFYRNATAELGDLVLPVTDWYEREDLNTFVQGTQLDPYLQWSGPLVAPVGERRSEQWILAELGARMGLPMMYDGDTDLLAMMVDGDLAGHGLSLDGLRAADRGVAVLAPTEPGGFLDRVTTDGTVAGHPDMLAPARERAAALFAELAAEPPHQLKLITRRTSHTLNSAMQNVEVLKAKGAADNPLHLSPSDAERLGVLDGGKVRVRNDHGELEATAKLDATLRPGVVAMTHGFGNAATPGMPVAQAHPGVNVNVLAPTGPGTIDPTSAMSQLTGIAVEVEAL